jgi:hypothetical protein
MATSIQLVFDTAHPSRQAAFWSAALGYRLQDPPAGFATWEDALRSWGIPRGALERRERDRRPRGQGPRIYFQRVPEGKVAKNRLHLDLNVGGGPDVPLAQRRLRVGAEVARLKDLGASDERGPIQKDDEYWVRMNDPEGNEFCVQ